MTVVSLQAKRAQKREAQIVKLLDDPDSQWVVILLQGLNTLFQDLTNKKEHDFLSLGIAFHYTIAKYPNPNVLQLWGTDQNEPEDQRFIVIERRSNARRSHYQTLDVHTQACHERLSNFVHVWVQRRQGLKSRDEIEVVPMHSLVPTYILGVLCGMMAKVQHYDFDHDTARCSFRIVSEVNGCEYNVRINMDAISDYEPWNETETE